MKKIEYIVPEMEVLEMNYNHSLLAVSSETEPSWDPDPATPGDPDDLPD